MGGLSRKAFQFRKNVQQEQLPVLRVDGGNLLFKGSRISDAQREQVVITAHGIVQAYNAMGYQGIGVAAQDLALGLSFLKETVNNATFPWLSANLYSKSQASPIFTPSTIIEVGSLHVGLIGITGKIDQFVNEKEDVIVRPWREILPGIIDDLSSKSDMLILLSNLTNAENREIANKFPVHIIIQSGVSTVNVTPSPLANTLICQTGKQGKYIGIMKISWQKSKIWGEKTAETLKKTKQTFDRLEWQLSKYEKYATPLDDLKEMPIKLKAYQDLIAQKERYSQEITKLAQELSDQESAHSTPSTFSSQFIDMKTSLPNDNEIQEIVEGINQKINEAGSRKTKAQSVLTNTYAGWQSCKACHEKIFSRWSETPHAKAYNTLVQKRQQFNVDCLLCHVTGITEENADLSLSLPESMRNVGCESCHEAALQHTTHPSTIHPVKVPDASTCLRCHTEAHDDSFDYQRDRIKVHPIKP